MIDRALEVHLENEELLLRSFTAAELPAFDGLLRKLLKELDEQDDAATGG